MIYVYSKAGCSGCEMLKGQLKQASIPFTEVRVDQDPEALAFMKEQGFRSVPQVFEAAVYIGTKFADVQAYMSKQA